MALRHVFEVGSFASAITDRRLAARNLLILLLMVATRAVHRRKNRLSKYAILGCVPPADEANVGATLVGLLLEAAPDVWSFASLAPNALPKDAQDGVPR